MQMNEDANNTLALLNTKAALYLYTYFFVKSSLLQRSLYILYPLSHLNIYLQLFSQIYEIYS